MNTTPPNLVDRTIEVFDRQYRGRGFGSQRTYPNESLIQFLASRYFKLNSDDRATVRVLEVGCGSGANLWMIAKEGFETHGIDSSEEAIALAQKHLHEKWGVTALLRHGSLLELPYPAAHFEVVVDVVSLQHLDLRSSRQALGEIARVLKPGGTLFSYRLSDQSAMRDAGPRVDEVTLSDITQAGMPLAHNGATSFWSPAIAQQLYALAGLTVDAVERVGRTYANGMFVEYLSIVGVKD
jgi:ubiquinone/menaquinone biosynthesis C-methylase UbiE